MILFDSLYNILWVYLVIFSSLSSFFCALHLSSFIHRRCCILGPEESRCLTAGSVCTGRQGETADSTEQRRPERDCWYDGGKLHFCAGNNNPEQLCVVVLTCSSSCEDDRDRGDLSVAEGRDEGNSEGSEENHGWPGPQLQGRHPEESLGEDKRSDWKQPQPTAAHYGNGDWSLSKGGKEERCFIPTPKLCTIV